MGIANGTQVSCDYSNVTITIGMATFDDYDGVYFTIQAIRLYHTEVECQFVVVDNNPSGKCAAALRSLGNWVPNYRYVAAGEIAGTAIRDRVFAEAQTEHVVCLDCHVMLVPGALAQLKDYFAANPQTKDLLQGPLIYDDLRNYSTHFAQGWRDGMWGTWATDQRGDGSEPFEIPMQGLGLFACRKAAWPGFNPAFRGFGGEEGYIHKKFRQAGGRTLCLPWLRWLHRFERPMGAAYPNVWGDRIANYLIGWREIGWNTTEMEAHFRAHVGNAAVDAALQMTGN